MRRAILAFACVALLATPPAHARAAGPNGMLAAVADGKVVTLNPDGGGQRVLWVPPDAREITGLAWSPDGNRLAVAQGDRIVVVDLAGAWYPVSRPTGARDFNPAWGIEGARLGFRRINAAGQWAIKALPDGSQPEPELLSGPPTEFAWAPGLVRWAVTVPDGLRVLGLDLPLFPKVVGAPAWSPDGSKLAFSDGVSLRTVTTDLLPVSTTVASDGGSAPRWSPDGSSLVYAAGTELRVVRAAGGTPVSVLPAMGASVTAVDWQPCRSDTTLCESVAPPRCTATAATVSTQADQAVDIPAPPCMDPAGRDLSLVIIKAPEHGTLSGRRYTPFAGFSGQDAVGYRVSNGAGESETVRVTIFVVPRPVAAGVPAARPPVLPVGAPFLSARANPKLDRQRRTSVRLACDQNCAFSLRLSARLRSRKSVRGPVVKHTLAAGKVLTVHLRLPAKPKGTIKTAWITGSVRNAAGDARSVRLPVTLPKR